MHAEPSSVTETPFPHATSEDESLAMLEEQEKEKQERAQRKWIREETAIKKKRAQKA